MILRSLAWSICLALAALLSATLSDAQPSETPVHSNIEKALNDSLLWGPYRSNLYFGVRPRIPKSLITGLLWSRVEDYQSIQNTFRHTCEQTEGMAGYGWEEYDVRTGGRQTIHDAGNLLDLTTEFVKIPGGNHGGGWAARITGTPREDAPADIKTTVVFYTGIDGFGTVEVANEYDQLGYEGTVSLTGQSQELGDFKLDITEGPRTNSHPSAQYPGYAERPLDRTRVRSLQVPEAALWQAKGLLFQELQKQVEGFVEELGKDKLPPPWAAFTISHPEPEPSNMHLAQKVFEGSFEFDILFSSSSAPNPVTSEDLTQRIKTASKSFSERYKQIFKASPPFDKSKYDAFSKSLFSNLVGGIGYFYGDQVVDRSYAPEYDEENEGFWEEAAEARGRNQQAPEGPSELFTAIPSRPFFPRGFLWDEGFHLLPVIDWDIPLTLEILRSWFKLMDEDGWIAREQIIGAEARSKVPVDFLTQYPHYANPPTLFLVIEVLLDKLNAASLSSDDKQAITSTLRELYPLLKRHYAWYRKTQWGDLKSYDRPAFSSKEAYRWRGRTPAHILTSGLDDYPRAQPPHPGELHVDLMSWMGLMTRSLKRVAVTLNDKEDIHMFTTYETAINRNIDDLHWDAATQTYCDSTVDDYEESVHVCHKGYISIFPFMTGMLAADNPRLGAVLDLISNPNELWSAHGIRSLSKQDALYGTDENYWRSPVWMNINYLIIDNLLRVSQIKGAHQRKALESYTKLRRNLVNTVYESWKTTGFAWEQYNPETGDGQRTQHFTGWTSLIVKIMCMPDLKDDLGHGEL